MPTVAPTISVALAPPVAFIKLAGRANFSSSVHFKRLVGELAERGSRQFIIDLTDCPIMDSTFLGVLAALGLKFSETKGPDRPGPIQLFNPNPRITELLENLGVTHLFRIAQGEDLFHPEFCPQPAQAQDGSKLEISKTCLEAHKTLMAINPANVPKFKDVTQFFAEDLKKLSGQG